MEKRPFMATHNGQADLPRQGPDPAPRPRLWVTATGFAGGRAAGGPAPARPTIASRDRIMRARGYSEGGAQAVNAPLNDFGRILSIASRSRPQRADPCAPYSRLFAVSTILGGMSVAQAENAHLHHRQQCRRLWRRPLPGHRRRMRQGRRDRLLPLARIRQGRVLSQGRSRRDHRRGARPMAAAAAAQIARNSSPSSARAEPSPAFAPS